VTSAPVGAKVRVPVDRRGYWCVLEPSLVRAELADRALCTPDRHRALMPN